MYREQRDNDNTLKGYIRISDNASIPLNMGNRDYQEVLEWLKTNTATPDPNVLNAVKQKKINEYKQEALSRIQSTMPEWDDIEKIKFLASIWNMLGAPNANQNAAKNVYLYVKNTAIPKVRALTTVEGIQGIDVVSDPNWP